MRAEFLKIRSMPTPMWAGITLLAFFVCGIAASVIWGVGEDNAVLDLAIGLPTMICSIVLGSWIAGVEFGQNTLRRVLSADPRRVRLILVKLAALLVTIVTVTTVLTLLGVFIYSLAGSGHDTSIDFSFVPRMLASSLVFNISYAASAISLTLLTRSMAGGLTLTFVFYFVIDGLLSLIPTVGDYTVGVALNDVDLAIRQQETGLFDQAAKHDVLVSALVLVAWLAVFLAAGIMRTVKTEVK